MDERGIVEAEEGGDAGGAVAEGSEVGVALAFDSEDVGCSVGVVFGGEGVRVGREDAVAGWTRRVVVRKGLIILVGLGCEGHTVLFAPEIFRDT